VDATSVSVEASNDPSSEGMTELLLSTSASLPYDGPNQPRDIDTFPKQTIVSKGKTKVLRFQCSWYDRYPWLHFSPDLNAVVCFKCSTANRLSLLALTTQNEPTFLTKGSAGFTYVEAPGPVSWCRPLSPGFGYVRLWLTADSRPVGVGPAGVCVALKPSAHSCYLFKSMATAQNAFYGTKYTTQSGVTAAELS
jgi:hypothetical protein